MMKNLLLKLCLIILVLPISSYTPDKVLASYCGDQVCDVVGGEMHSTCSEDCEDQQGFCGDNICQMEIGENLKNCSQDCSLANIVFAGTCGDGICDGRNGETETSCSKDCSTKNVCKIRGCKDPSSCKTSCDIRTDKKTYQEISTSKAEVRQVKEKQSSSLDQIKHRGKNKKAINNQTKNKDLQWGSLFDILRVESVELSFWTH